MPESRANFYDDFMTEEELGEEEKKRIAKSAGNVSHAVLEKARGLVKPGAKLMDVANELEKFIIGTGFDLAFPVNLSINEQAAHYTPSVDDQKTFSNSDLVKVDVGMGQRGILTDCAITIDLSGRHEVLVSATNEALQKVVSNAKAGIEVGKIGNIVEEHLKSRGFIPIKNLGGHGLGVHELHGEPFIPNFDNKDATKLQDGALIALEVFATYPKNRGVVVNSDVNEIFGYVEDAQSRSESARKLLQQIKEKYPTEPFAARWLYSKELSKFELYAAIGELVRVGALESYTALIEASNGFVAQAEVDAIVTKDGCEVVTKSNSK